MVRFQIRMDETSFRALMVVAKQEERDMRKQAALIIRQDLERRGLLAKESKTSEKQGEKNVDQHTPN